MPYFWIFFLLLFSSCEVKVGAKEEDRLEKQARNKSKIRNNIDVQSAGGVKVEQAFLTYADEGTLVNGENVTSVNKPVKLNLIVKGWKATGDKLTLDAEQKISTSEGQVILERKNMFAGANPVSLEDAAYLSFRVVITEIRELLNYFLVEVVVRNKAFKQQVKASFKIQVE